MAPAARRAAILAATVPLVRRHGAGVTTRQIAEAAGVAEGTIFRVFPDKESLVRAAIGEAYDPESALRELAAIDHALPLRARLTAAAAVLQRRLAEIFGLLEALGWPGPPDESDREPAAKVDAAFRAAIVDLVGADAATLRVPADDLAHVLRMLVFSSAHPMISGGRPLAAEEIVTVLLDGLLAPTTTAEDPAC
jgi:AcrR family transcriptional regulator